MNQKIKISARQKQIIIGKLLGDGHLETQTKGHSYRLKIEHSLKQREYVDWLYSELENMAANNPQARSISFKGKTYEKYWFNTMYSPSLNFFAHQFYPAGKKIVPKLIKRWLTPLALAVWFMDDGSIKSKECKGLIINTQSFGHQSLNLLKDVFKDKYQIQIKFRKQKEGIQIYIPADESMNFRKVIEPYILPSMNYKIRLTNLPKM